MSPRRIAAASLVSCLLVAPPAHGQSGDLDPSFGVNGLSVADFFGAADALHGLAMAPDGTLVAAGFAFRPGHDDFAVARYSADGQPIASVTIDFHPGELINDEASHVAVLPDGRILVAGVTASSPSIAGFDVALVRLLPTMALDPSFGTGGGVITPFDGFGFVTGLALQPDGGIVLSGAFGVLRYLADGSLDATFAAGGRMSPVFSDRESPQAIAVQPDGRIVVVGSTFDTGANELSMARFLPDGTLDASFGAGGTVFLRDYSAVPRAIALQPDGRIVVAGLVAGPDRADFALWRFESGGALDPSFGGDGRVFTDFGEFDQAFDVALHGDGRIVAAGYTQEFGKPETTDFAVARFEPDGSLDSSFGAGGHATADFFGLEDAANAMVIQPGRGVVLGGGVANPNTGSQDFGLARFDAQAPNQPPVISRPVASRRVLWPPNHRLVEVAIDYAVTDDSDPSPTCSLGVTSNEPARARGSGRTALDWEVIDAHLVKLRAERAGGGAGRVYTVAITCVDSAGLQAQRDVRVRVPRSR
jgi:uncharacterized delta-60 repeat protein